ncbi:MAG TPA: triose-phosphate isomerase [Thermoanaerobaculia bacterium]|nr:triose-phosphate isomerase [Thermoanaerobaculia bacterium]
MRHLIANWKMNLPQGGIEAWVSAVSSAPSSETAPRLGVAPPAPFIARVRDLQAGSAVPLLLAAQNCSEHASGAYTGEVSAGMLGLAGAEMILVGHSERRALFGEDDATVGRKLAAVLSAGLRPLLCVGEDLPTRENGGTVALLTRQLDAAFAPLAQPPSEILVAYEPVWAIGTGRNATPSMAADAHRAIRRHVEAWSRSATHTVVLYGGSVKPENATELAAESEIEGFLVGGASLEADSFRAIAAALGTA